MNIEIQLKEAIIEAVQHLYKQAANEKAIQIQDTRKEFAGDFTIVVFPFLKMSKKSAEATAQEIGEYVLENTKEVEAFNVIKGFLNLSIGNEYWVDFMNQNFGNEDFGIVAESGDAEKVMVEFSSPNTNKPLHLGHIRNILLGDAVARILKANGKKVYSVNLVNDRGIHICKSMLAWQKWGNGATPESTGQKGDKLVGDYYIKFDQEYKKEIAGLVAAGTDEKLAKDQAPLLVEAREMLLEWEAGNEEVRKLWATMNGWVYEGFDKTYEKMGIDFDKIYYESDTYTLGKELVLEGLNTGALHKKEDGSIWADLTSNGLDEKILLRSDGTSVYMTQDVGTAHQRFSDFHIDKHIYVVGNEQNYHFQVLKLVLKKLGFDWADAIYHLSYGMVELPSGKMKSREGTVVDADDLIDEMLRTAREISKEQGKLENFSKEEVTEILRKISLGALKFFILKVDPKKSMTFIPEDSIDFNGNTGPFVQYSYARIQSIFRKAKEKDIEIPTGLMADFNFDEKEMQLLKMNFSFPATVHEAGKNLSPALIANYVYELAREYNQFYHELPILIEEDKAKRDLRLMLSEFTGNTIKSAMGLLGIEVPPAM
ncbi:MAG: arginine--tRNA ligase [Bacteroidales bacterium]|nr:arginine--tRNA ligase [Bacteroidales bacterium]MCF8455412.1 arginine--tRNA ligase [Bacteroidales bacterium]